MAFVWFLLLVAVGIWALRLAQARATLLRENATLLRENATLQSNNYGLYHQSQALGAQVQGLQNERWHLLQQLQTLTTENASLSQYRHIVDAQAEVARTHAAGAAELASARQQATAIVGAAKGQAVEIVSEAQRLAQVTAGEALDAKHNLEIYRREARALQNVIDGYGDRYLVPRDAVLDGLAESFGHTDAGARLKQARQHMRILVKSGSAATCEYVEAERRGVAIDFVADAFNGKVEAILARVKADNFGTLRQEILDAFALVNKNGRAFRNARITDAYREARIDELRWASAVHELKEREREEQRRINEQIREEEKSRREYERAQREAAKEEEVIRRAMEKAQHEIARATDSQRAKYEEQLRMLTERLHEAEEKSQRALSMAQQTKRGHVYIISNVGSFGDQVFKIGLTRRLDPMDRVRELGDASVPFEFDVHALIASDDAPSLERILHRHFLAAQVNKINPRKEFFRASLSMIRAEVEKLGIQASWTMLAAAEEYRESQAIERAIKDDPAAYDAWVNRQLVLDPVSVEPADDWDAAASVGIPTMAAQPS